MIKLICKNCASDNLMYQTTEYNTENGTVEFFGCEDCKRVTTLIVTTSSVTWQ